MKRLTVALMILAMLLSLMACARAPADTPATADPAAATGDPAPADAPVAEPVDTPNPAEEPIEVPLDEEPEVRLPTAQTPVTMPIVEEPMSFTCWTQGYMLQNTGLEDYNDGMFWQNLESISGVHVDWTIASATDAITQWNLMIASEMYDDALTPSNTSAFFKAGLDAYIEDEIIIPLNDYMEYLPNYNYRRAQSEETRRNTVTEGGNIAAVLQIKTPFQPAWAGLVIREDLLRSFGWEGERDDVTTLAKFEEVLQLFKDNGIEIPYMTAASVSGSTGLDSYILASYGLYNGGLLYQLYGQVHLGVAEEPFKDYLKTMNSWFSKGYIDPDFMSYAGNDGDGNMRGGKVGVGNTYKAYYDTLNKITDNGGHWEPLTVPMAEEGKQIEGAHAGTSHALTQAQSLCISTACPEEKIPVILKLWDYLYSDEGSFTANYGFEGVSFDYNEAGEPVFKSFMNDGADGYNFNQHLTQYCMIHNWPMYYQWLRTETNISDDARNLWRTWEKNYIEDLQELPTISVPLEIVSEYSAAYNEITTYAAEFTMKAIVGEIDVDTEWDAYLAEIESLGLAFVLQTMQDCLDNYYSRDINVGF